MGRRRAMRLSRAVSACARAFIAVAGIVSTCSMVAAQDLANSSGSVEAPAPTGGVALYPDAPPPPIAPDVITRDQEGRATVRAVRLSQPLHIDGALDEALYRDVA
jgi:hypothetical protein